VLASGLTYGVSETQCAGCGDLEVGDQGQGERELEDGVQANFSRNSLAFLEDTGDLIMGEDVVQPLGGDIQCKCCGSNGIRSGHKLSYSKRIIK
jgi:hypothetical protein